MGKNKKGCDIMNTNELKKYIGNIFELEVSLYNQKSLFKKLLDETTLLAKVNGKELNKVWSTKINFSMKEIMPFIVMGACIGTLIGGFSSIPFFAGTVGGIVVGILIYAISEGYDISKAKEHNRQVSIINQEIMNNNTNLQKTMKRRRDVINQELDIIKTSYEKTKQILEQYYNKNVVHITYRNLLAISSIYEYLSSGRCYTLEGHEGAYNLFENEVRQNIIISKLDEVIYHLEQIERNQHMLYTAIKENNASIQRLTQEMYKVADNLQRIESSNQIIAYNSKIAAKNSEIQTWLEIYR